jgi:small redox-active disulfide protein 2
MKQVQVLGTGCPKCKKLASLVERVAQERQLDVQIEKVTDITRIADFGAVTTPALAIDGRIVVAGKIPSEDELASHLA